MTKEQAEFKAVPYRAMPHLRVRVRFARSAWRCELQRVAGGDWFVAP